MANEEIVILYDGHHQPTTVLAVAEETVRIDISESPTGRDAPSYSFVGGDGVAKADEKS